MRIKDLFENKSYNFDEFVNEKNELNYDLVEDLVYFMNHDDDVYRRHLYPSITKCLSLMKSKKDSSPLMFKDATLEGYKSYCNKFPIRELPSSLDEKMIEKVCKQIHEEICKHEKEGLYKD